MHQDSEGKSCKRSADPPEMDGDGSQDAQPSRKKAKMEPADDLELNKVYDPAYDFEPEPTCSYASTSAYMMEDGNNNNNNNDEEMSSLYNFYDESPTRPPVHVPNVHPDYMRMAHAYSESLMCKDQNAPRSCPKVSTSDLNNPSAFGRDAPDETMDLELGSIDTYTQSYVAWQWGQQMVHFSHLPLSTGHPAPPRTCTVTQPTHSDPTEADSSSSQYYSDVFPQ